MTSKQPHLNPEIARATAHIITIANQKGGVGKTTTAVNIATAVAALGKKVLLIDLDSQGNASTSLGISPADRPITIYDVIIDRHNIERSIMQSSMPLLDIIPASIDLVVVDIELADAPQKQIILRNKIAPIASNYDYIFLDCPPSIGLITLNALIAAENLLIPMQCEFLAMEGIAYMLNTIKLIRNAHPNVLRNIGIVLTMFDKRNRLCVQVADEVRAELGDIVFETYIPRNIKLSEAPSHGKPAIIYDMKCLGSISYMMLAQEFLEKMSRGSW